MTRRNKAPILGWILLLVGGFLLLTHWYPITLNWTTLLMILGIGLFLIGVFHRDHGAVFPGTFLFLLGLLFYLRENYILITSWWNVWPLIILSIGVAFLILYIFEPDRKGVLFPGVILIAIGLIFLFVPWSLCWWEFIYWIGKLWPLILIVVGLHLILKSVRRKSAGN